MKKTRCTDCYAEFDDAELRGKNACPSCGTKSVPMAIAQDVTIKINWHELRILTMWASRWADQMSGDRADVRRRTLQSLLRRLNAFRPTGAGALTIVGEVKELQKHYPSASLIDASGETIMPPRETATPDRDVPVHVHLGTSHRSDPESTQLVVEFRTSIADVRAAKPSTIYYGANTCWWTHDPKHLRRLPPTRHGLPCDPRGGMLFETDNVEKFLSCAEAATEHYGRHGLRAFIAAHHDNCRTEDGRPWCAESWEHYNAAIDRLDARHAKGGAA